MKLTKKLKHTIRDILFFCISRISLKTYSDILYQRTFKKKIDWDHPKDINEKIQWLKFNSNTTKWAEYSDKYLVRNHIEECGLKDILVPLLGKWERAEDIDWEALPNQFVMKTNHGSGDVLVCHDKSKLSITEWTLKFSKLLKSSFGYEFAEPHYNRITPCIIAEAFLDPKTQPLKTSSIIDYKIWAFDGKPAYVWACFNRTPHSVEVGLYDLDWNLHKEYSVSTSHYILADNPIPRPEALDEMLEVAAILSKGFPELRCDLYAVGKKVYFGEMTFSSCAGLNDQYTPKFLRILGDLCVFDNKMINRSI